MDNEIVLPKKPRPVQPIIWSLMTVGYIAVSIAYFAADETFLGWFWAACSLVFIVYTVPTSIRTYRMRMETWHLRCDRIREFEARINSWRPRFLPERTWTSDAD